MLTPPAVSAYDAAGAGDSDVNKSVTRFQILLYGASVNLVKRFAQLPEGRWGLHWLAQSI